MIAINQPDRLGGPQAQQFAKESTMTHAQTADVRIGTTIPATLAALAVVVMAAGAIVLTQLKPLDLQVGAPAAAQDQALIQSGQAWENERQQQMSGGIVSSTVLESGRDWEARYEATTPAAATTDFGGELHSEYLIEMFGTDGDAAAPAAGTESNRTPQPR
jgi:hypothetical protein